MLQLRTLWLMAFYVLGVSPEIVKFSEWCELQYFKPDPVADAMLHCGERQTASGVLSVVCAIGDARGPRSGYLHACGDDSKVVR